VVELVGSHLEGIGGVIMATAELPVAPESTGRLWDRQIGKPTQLTFLEGIADTQLGPLYLGIWGLLAFFVGGFGFLLWFYVLLQQVNYSSGLFLRDFVSLSVDPPPAQYGLGFAPLRAGGYWLVLNALWTTSVGFWWLRVFTRARQLGLRPWLAMAFLSAIGLYATIWIIHPILVGQWADAPGWGIQSHLNWANNFSIKYGNFYYNPFHMLSVACLLGSTMLFGMHGATIVATEKDGGEKEIENIETQKAYYLPQPDMTQNDGIEKGMLFWRWTMGFNATSYTIHLWIVWFAMFTMIFGILGVLASGTLVQNWYEWGLRNNLTYPYPVR